MTSAFQKSLESGYTEDEVFSYLEKNPKYAEKIKKSRDAGYSNEEIKKFLSTYKPKQGVQANEEEVQPERSTLEKGSRIAGQFGKGLLGAATAPQTLASIGSKLIMKAPGVEKEAYRRQLFEDIEQMAEQKQTGVWSPKDEELLQHLTDQVKNPEKMEQYLSHGEGLDIDPVSLAEKGLEATTGINLKPEGILEHAANWAGLIKDPKKILELAKSGVSKVDLVNAILPSGKEALSSLGAGTGLQMAEDGEFGPIGTMAAALVGDLLGKGGKGIAKVAFNLATKPKKTLAEGVSKFTSKEKLALQKDLIKDFRDSGIQADIGSLTGSNLLKFTQSRLAQSGLTGKALDDFKKELTNQIKGEYKNVADQLGMAKFSTTHEAGEVARDGMRALRDADLKETRKLYEKADKALKENAYVPSKKLANAIEDLEKKLKPGNIKSPQQKTVLDTLEKLKRDFYDASGKPMYADVKDLMNNKIALNDLINYEVQGGSKQLLKGIVGEIDRAIISHGKDNPIFARNYISANKKFSQHAKTFRNKSVDQLLNLEDPSKLMGKMNSVQDIRNMGNILSKTPEGKEIFNGLKRLKLDQVIGDNLEDSISQQLKLGTFSKILEKGKNREIFGEVLGKRGLKRLEKLQKNSGVLAESAQKFFNASKSGTTIEDVALVGKVLTDIGQFVAGNPWALAKTTGGIVGARALTKLIADPEFLKLTEEAILATQKGSQINLMQIGQEMLPAIKAAMLTNQEENSFSEAQSEKNM